MALKKSELYSSLWESCNVLRGGMDASQYKNYVLGVLFIKYVSDKYAGQPYAPVTIPKGASFKDMVALKGNPHIGDLINKKVIAPLEKANQLSGFPDFNDAALLGSGKDMVDRLTRLISVFENPALDFSSNKAGGDDILGDAYEYLMRKFAVESGKSKGQFYTPAEVSRILAKAIGIHKAKTSKSTTAYDPTCGSGSLLLKVADEAPTKITLFGQESDVPTSGLARMNMVLHDNAEAEIKQGNTLADPKFKVGDNLQTFDYVVANPPFSDDDWSIGFDPKNDLYDRFVPYGLPPDKQGDYAYLLHIIRSMKSTGKAACILPHGVLFRGNAEEVIRRNLIKRGYIKAIVGLPPNLFYGTGIPACILVLDKEGAEKRKGIFMIDASKGFEKDGPKNRLREQDIHKIVDALEKQSNDNPKFARMVPIEEISDAKNNYNLNIPRYIDSAEPEDIHDLEGHLKGGIPDQDVQKLQTFWEVMPTVRKQLFKPLRKGYFQIPLEKGEIKKTIHEHPEFKEFIAKAGKAFAKWNKKAGVRLNNVKKRDNPKHLIAEIADELLATYKNVDLVDPYSVYQRIMDYWIETMQDDCYSIAADGWFASPARVTETDKKGKTKDKGWECSLLPKAILIDRHFAEDKARLNDKVVALEQEEASLLELEEEHGGEDGYLGALGKISKGEVKARQKRIKDDPEAKEENQVLNRWLEISDKVSVLRKAVKEHESELDKLALQKYLHLTEEEIKDLVVNEKWMNSIKFRVEEEVERVSQHLTSRVFELKERYDEDAPSILDEVESFSGKVDAHLKKMGVSWG